MTPLTRFKQHMTKVQKRRFDRLVSPARVQVFLEEVPYIDSDHYRSPLSVLNGAGACCYEGALVAAAAFWYHGKPPLIVELFAEDDDDHILALFRERGFWGACAKSNFSGLRGREPVYRTVRELVLSYFDGYYNEKARYTLRGYTVPVDLRRFGAVQWLTEDKETEVISDAIDRLRRIRIVTSGQARGLSLVDERSYRAGLLGGTGTDAFAHYPEKRRIK